MAECYELGGVERLWDRGPSSTVLDSGMPMFARLVDIISSRSFMWTSDFVVLK